MKRKNEYMSVEEFRIFRADRYGERSIIFSIFEVLGKWAERIKKRKEEKS